MWQGIKTALNLKCIEHLQVYSYRNVLINYDSRLFGINIFMQVLFWCFSPISLVQILSILEGLGLVALVVDQLSPNWNLAPVQGFLLLLLQHFVYTHINAVKSRKVHADPACEGQCSRQIYNEFDAAHLGHMEKSQGSELWQDKLPIPPF